MKTLTAAQKNTVESLAVSYNAFNIAHKKEDHSGVIAWGIVLKDAQRDTGVMLYDESLINLLINTAKDKKAEQAA